jgi:hypothetical protein
MIIRINEVIMKMGDIREGAWVKAVTRKKYDILKGLSPYVS